ncbi:MAG: sugar transferase [Lachnospiraceae bacterium]|nr:sugar transferase [Lachnospiraceae bacterium]
MNSLQLRKRLYNFIISLIIVALETGVMAYIEVVYYNTELPKAFYFWGHVFIAFVYAFILFVFSAMYGGLKVGSFRMIELLFSQGVSTFITNVIFYAIVTLLAYHFPSIIPLMVGTIIQCFIIGLWIITATYIHRFLFPPLDVLLIYGNDNKDSFVEKVKTRRHQFKINESIYAEEPISEITAAVDRHKAVMLWDVSDVMRKDIFKYCYEHSVETYVMPKIMDIILRGATPVHIFDTPLLLTKSSPIEFEQLAFKRLFDIILSLVLIVVSSPFMLITALCVKLYDGGHIIYSQKRLTIDNKEFNIYKFRSMREDAESDGVARLASEKDDRVTPIGKVIRKVRLDELPQLFNVLAGSMSFVGPRPERPEIAAKYIEDMPEFAYRTKVKAGITGYAQVYGKYNTVPYDKLKLDLYYIENFSVWMDIKLVILTVRTLCKFDSTEGVAKGNITPIEADNDK